GVDTDGDGISDDDEINLWETNPNDVDTDGDGLDDGLEAFTLGTAPGWADTDGDGINDDVEIAGFFYITKTWYLDPLSIDSNQDGMTDGEECSRRIFGTPLYMPTAICPDTDGDGKPDVYDEDNDNDGVLDKFDISPLGQAGQVFDEANPFEWRLDNLETDRTVFLDFQIRPNDPDNLALYGNVLDWPTGDKDGQITRHLDTTFADTANLDLRSTADNAANGDVRLTPVLEILIPGTAGHYGNLPVLPVYSGSPRPANLPAEEWLDTSRLSPYNITANDTGDPSDPYRDLVVYVPVTVQTDPDSGLPIAFGAHVPYFPEQGTVGDPNIVDWGSSHEARLIWLVQMISDQCINENDDPETCSREDVLKVINVYDESWKLTGLKVSEEHGVDVGIIYEDPTIDPSFQTDDQLWAAANSLNGTFLRGRDYDNNGERDVRVDNLATELPSWHDAGSGPYYLGYQPLIGLYDDSDQIYQVMMTETVSLLNTVYAGYENQTDPTLLFVRETTNRLVSLEMMSNVDNLFTADFDPALVFPTTTADMNWKPYDYVGGEWTNADPATYLEDLEANLSELVFVEPSNATQEEIDAIEGQRYWAQIYYATLYQGIGNLVESNGEVIWLTDATVDETLYEPSWPSATFKGASYAATAFFLAFVAAIVPTVANVFNKSSIISSGTVFKNSFWSSYNASRDRTFGRNDLFPQSARNPTSSSFMTHVIDVSMWLVIGASAIGLLLLAKGYFGGDNQALNWGLYILNFVSLAVSLGHLALITYALVKILTLAGTQAAAGVAAVARCQAYIKGSEVFGKLGFVLGIIIPWGFFLYEWLSGGFGGNKIARNYNIAIAIASTTIALVFFFLDVVLKLLIGVLVSAAAAAVASIFILLIAIVDVILYFAGEKTITERITEEIADSIYDIDFILSGFNSPNRLSFNLTDITLADDSLGFTVGNSFYPVLTITNTIHFRKQSNNDEARRSAFAYYIQTAEIDQHDDLNGNSMH
ncbi:MAG: hypothetical protein WAM60_10950, partial [Candidatus Promineifilaceae bacterium]